MVESDIAAIDRYIEEESKVEERKAPAANQQMAEAEVGHATRSNKFSCYLVTKSNCLQNYTIEANQKSLNILSPNKGKVKSRVSTEQVHVK